MMVWGFEDLESAREYLAKYLLNYIHIELDALPKEEWDKTLSTWAKICLFAKSLIDKSDEERKELYQKYNFDLTMIGIAEDVRHTLLGMYSLGLLKREENPAKLLPLSAKMVLEKQELLDSYGLKREIIEYVRDFFTKKA